MASIDLEQAHAVIAAGRAKADEISVSLYGLAASNDGQVITFPRRR